MGLGGERKDIYYYRNIVIWGYVIIFIDWSRVCEKSKVIEEGVITIQLIIYSIICGFLGRIVGSVILNIGGQAGEFGIILFGVVGFISPAFYQLNRIYTDNKHSNKTKFDVDVISTLNDLKSNNILNDDEYEKSLCNLNLVDESKENLKKYDESVKVLFNLSQKNIILDDEEDYKKKIVLLKHLYKQI